MRKLLFLTLVLCLFIVFVSCSKPKLAMENEEKTEQKVEAPFPSNVEHLAIYPEINAMDLVADFEEDETRALSMYKGKIYDITGVIEEIGTDLLDRPFVVLGKEGGVGLEGGALCRFDKTNSDRISKLNLGETITIRGKIESYLLKVTVTECTFTTIEVIFPD